MLADRTNPLSRYFHSLVVAPRVAEASDGELMQQFTSAREEAMTALIRRHGPTVLSLCRRVLRNEQDAEDAFQATFLLLAQKASGLREQASVSSWLYGVAYRTALKARTAAARRSAREARAPVRTVGDPLAEMTVLEAQGVVDEELARLPDKYRAPLVLCCLEGLARDEAAQRLGVPLASLKSRLERARELLRSRLARRGLALPAGFLAVELLGTPSQAAVSAALAEATARAAARALAGAPLATIVSPRVTALTEGVARAMSFPKVKVVTALFLTLCTAGLDIAAALWTALPRFPEQGGEEPAPTLSARAPAPAPARPKVTLKPESLERWGRAEAVFTARLLNVAAGPVAPSEPPVYKHQLEFQVNKSLRGSLKKGERVVGWHSARQKAEPVFPTGKDCLVAVSKTRGQWRVEAVQVETAAELAQAELAARVPVGWTVSGGELVSPWAGLGKKAWPAGQAGQARFVCGQTGRPALQAGAGVEFTVEPVPPKVKLKYGNPDGDGEYQITVKNVTDKPVTVPALLSDGKRPLWNESLVIVCQKKVYTAPGAQGVAGKVRATTLKPGESVSGVVNVLGLKGPEWPRGGYRIEFTFGLGEKSVTKSFYYLSRHHDPIREKLARPG